MKINNESPFDPKVLKSLISFVRKRTDKKMWNMLYVHVVQQFHQKNVCGFGGWATIDNAAEFRFITPPEYRVYIRIEHADGCTYPMSMCRDKSVGELTYDNWEELFLATFAHEYKHAIMMYEHVVERNGSHDTISAPEADAERFAKWILLDYRDTLNKKAPKRARGKAKGKAGKKEKAE